MSSRLCSKYRRLRPRPSVQLGTGNEFHGAFEYGRSRRGHLCNRVHATSEGGHRVSVHAALPRGLRQGPCQVRDRGDAGLRGAVRAQAGDGLFGARARGQHRCAVRYHDQGDVAGAFSGGGSWTAPRLAGVRLRWMRHSGPWLTTRSAASSGTASRRSRSRTSVPGELHQHRGALPPTIRCRGSRKTGSR